MASDEVRRRGRVRDRSLWQTLGASAGIQIATVAGALVSLPFVTRSLTGPQYGVLATVTGFVAILGFADLGVGSALTGRLAEADLYESKQSVERLVSSALAVALVAAALVLIVGTSLTFAVRWQTLLGADSIREGTLRACVLSVIAATAISVVGSLGHRALYGIQRGHTANYWLGAGAVASAGASVVIAAWRGPLWAYVAALVGSPALVSLVCTWWTMRFTELHTRPRIALVTRFDIRRIAGSGGWFLLIALSGALSFQTDALVAASVLGASAGGIYSVATRLFGLVTSCVYPSLLQLWPAFTEAMVRGDTVWVRTRFWWSSALAFTASGGAGVVVVIVGPPFVQDWLTAGLVPSRELLVAMSIWTALSLGAAPLMFTLNAFGKVREHALMSTSMAAANIPLSLLLTRRMGIAGPVYGSLVSTLVFAWLPAAVVVRRCFQSLAPAVLSPADACPPKVRRSRGL